MAATIQLTKKLLNELDKRKTDKNDTYEDVIWDLLEDTMEVSEQTKKDIEQARKEFEQGKYYTHEQVKKMCGLK